ncbi:MAG: heavy metal sensor histidine kinase [Lautropia sp.]
MRLIRSLPDNSIATRLALMFAIASLIAIGIVGLVLHQVLANALEQHRRSEVEGRLDDVRYLLELGRGPDLAALARETMSALTASNGSTRFWIWSDDPGYRYGTGVGPVLEASGHHAGARMVSLVTTGGTRYAIAAVDLPATADRPALRLIAGIDDSAFVRTRRIFDTALILLTIVAALLAASLGYRIARVGLTPVRRLSAEVQRIGPANLGQRLELPALPVELSDLGGSFNAALDRLDAAYRQLDSFNADVAHELRTPLANLIGQTQVALARDRPAPMLRDVLQSNLEELERLRTIISDMLFLARAEQGQRARATTPVSLAGEVARIVEFFEILLDEARMQVRIEGYAVAPVEVTLFRRALTNLMQNAIQHSPAGATIVVNIARRPDATVEIALNNPSEAITPERLARLFDRFYRVAAARSGPGDRTGLGLAIVKGIAAMHGGTVFAHSANGVTTIGFTVAAPAPGAGAAD